MSRKSTNFARISTEINEESDSECDIDNVEQMTDNEKSNMPQKNKLLIALICIFFFLVTAAITFGVVFGIFGLHKTANPNRPKSSIEKCDNLRCCKFKSLEIESHNIHCTSLQIEECVSNDAVCDWNCDVSAPTFLHRTFLRFDPGSGTMNDTVDDEVNDDDINDEDVSRSEASSVDDYLRQSKMISYSECGDVYEVDEDYSTAKERFNDMNSSHVSKGPNGDEKTRRRLNIFPSDGRVQSSVKNTAPFKYVGLLIAQSGGTSYGCTATLISRRVIITAAACVYDRSSSSFMSGLTFYPDIISATDPAAIAFNGVGAYVPQQYIDDEYLSTIFHNWALIRLSTDNTGIGWLQIGYDSSLSAPLAIDGIGYPLDKPSATRWIQSCNIGGVYSTVMLSNECDHYYGQNGEPIYDLSNGHNIIYGIWNSHSTSYNYYVRIVSSIWNVICDFISEGEDPLCSI